MQFFNRIITSSNPNPWNMFFTEPCISFLFCFQPEAHNFRRLTIQSFLTKKTIVSDFKSQTIFDNMLVFLSDSENRKRQQLRKSIISIWILQIVLYSFLSFDYYFYFYKSANCMKIIWMLCKRHHDLLISYKS
jgi:hypothetical protein